MKIYKWIICASLVVGGVSACADTTDVPSEAVNQTDDGVVKSSGVDEKSDAWNWRNNPVHFRAELNYSFEELPLEGASDRVAWPASYWPYYEDGINFRWQGTDTLSPAEKYDNAFNDWDVDDEFMQLRPFDTATCEYDEEYYTSLGPAASWTHQNNGNWMATNGVDDDGDGVADSEECGWGEDQDFDGIETWWGICHAWAPAAIMEDEPIEPIERNGVRFEVSDIKALLIEQYDRTDAYMLGGRCNEREIERDENGRIVTEDCRDLNAGTFHVIVSNFLGLNSRPIVIERTTGYEVWNQPLTGFKVTSHREVSLEEAHQLLNVEATPGTGEFVHGVEVGSTDANAILDLVNTASRDTLDVDVRLDRRAAQNIVDARPFDSLVELDEVPYVASRAFGKLLTFAKDNGYWVAPEQDYVYNPRAQRFIEVRATTDWVTESHASTEPMAPSVDRYTRHDHYHYLLELDAEGKIIGGEWLGSSHGTHPDFIWLPTRARYGNPHVDVNLVRDMVQESRQNLDSEEDVQTLRVSNEAAIEIPDNTPEGVSSFIDVEDTGVVKDVRINLDIEHTYRGDLIVELRHAGVAMNVYDGSEASNPWDDNVVIEGQLVDGFLGSELQGEWELFVYDRWAYDVGQLVSWSLDIEFE